MINPISDILFEEVPGYNGNLGLITLNRPKALNALNKVMCLALLEKLSEWEEKDTIKAVVIRAVEGKAFCAGGDIRSIYEAGLAKDPTLSQFFATEYKMNRYIYHFSKPYISLLNGITMGGGAGISIHGSHRIGTPNLTFAMPETAIGFYPDVGMTYQFARLPHKIGFYLGLSGARIDWSDCYAIGLLDEVVKPSSLDTILIALRDAPLPDNSAVTEVLKPFSEETSNSNLLTHKDEIEDCFSKNTVEEILQKLESGSEWAKNAAKEIQFKSPTSLKVTLHALQQAEKLNFDACMQMEYNLSCHFIKGPDFFEGIRAVIIDKDHKPHWNPAKLSDVTVQQVSKYFEPNTKEMV